MTTACWPATRTRTACRACRRAACTAARPIATTHFTNAAPKLSLRWDAATGLMLYANASRGFRPPEMTELYRLQRNQSVADLDSEQVDAYEIGLKFARGDWRGELAGFDMRKDNVILRDSNGFYVEQRPHVARRRRVHADVAGAGRRSPPPSRARTPGIATSSRAPSKAARRSRQATTWTPRRATCCVPRSSSGHCRAVAAEAEWLVVGDYFARRRQCPSLHRPRTAEPAGALGIRAAMVADAARQQCARSRVRRPCRLCVRQLPLFSGTPALGVCGAELASPVTARAADRQATARNACQWTGAEPNQCSFSARAATSPTMTSAGDFTAAARPASSSSARVASTTR